MLSDQTCIKEAFSPQSSGKIRKITLQYRVKYYCLLMYSSMCSVIKVTAELDDEFGMLRFIFVRVYFYF